jgi:hypothetical protein
VLTTSGAVGVSVEAPAGSTVASADVLVPDADAPPAFAEGRPLARSPEPGSFDSGLRVLPCLCADVDLSPVAAAVLPAGAITEDGFAGCPDPSDRSPPPDFFELETPPVVAPRTLALSLLCMPDVLACDVTERVSAFVVLLDGGALPCPTFFP